MSDLQIGVEMGPGEATISLAGHVDGEAGPLLAEVVERVLARRVPRLTFDLVDATAIDDDAIGALHDLGAMCVGRGVACRARVPNGGSPVGRAAERLGSTMSITVATDGRPFEPA